MTTDEAIEHEEFIANILKIREERRSRWRKVLENPIVALIIGSVLSTAAVLLTTKFQLAEQERFTGRLQSLTKAIEAPGKIMTASDNLLVVLRANANNDTGDDFSTNDETGYRQEFSRASSEWERERYSIAFFLSHYFKDEEKLTKNWTVLTAAVDSYSGCVATSAVGRAPVTDTSCRQEYDNLSDLVKQFGRGLPTP